MTDSMVYLGTVSFLFYKIIKIVPSTFNQEYSCVVWLKCFVHYYCWDLWGLGKFACMGNVWLACLLQTSYRYQRRVSLPSPRNTKRADWTLCYIVHCVILHSGFISTFPKGIPYDSSLTVDVPFYITFRKVVLLLNCYCLNFRIWEL